MVFDKVMERARAGDIAAARLVMQQLVGPPGSAVSLKEPDDPDPWTRWRKVEPLIADLVREIPIARLAAVIRAHGAGSATEPGGASEGMCSSDDHPQGSPRARTERSGEGGRWTAMRNLHGRWLPICAVA